MQVEILSFNERPSEIVEKAFDCIWINFTKFQAEAMLDSAPLQWIDWKMRGAISKVLLGNRMGEAPILIPTKGRLKTPFIALWSGKEALPEAFANNCTGQSWKDVLYFCASPSIWDGVGKEIKAAQGQETRVFLAKG